MTIDKNNEGAWRICENINGYLETKVYYFYTKKEAIKLFREHKKAIIEKQKGTMKKQLNQQLIKDNLLADMKHDNQLKKYVKDVENLDAKQFDVLISIFTKINLNKFKTYLI